jgi:hypothetical protein
MVSRTSVTHRVVILGNDGECRCEKIRSPWGGRTTHLRSQCSPDTVTEPALGEEIVPAL